MVRGGLLYGGVCDDEAVNWYLKGCRDLGLCIECGDCRCWCLIAKSCYLLLTWC